MLSTPASVSTLSQSSIAPAVSKPFVFVLQPRGVLNHLTSSAFLTEVAVALEQASEQVIVDLLWVDTIDEQGMAMLVASLEQAAVLGKKLVLHSLDYRTRTSLTAAVHRQSDADDWEHWFNPAFE